MKTAMKLTKTQEALLARLATGHNGQAAVECGRTIGGRSWGNRERAALCGLRDASLVTIIRIDRDTTYRNGIATHFTTLVYEMANRG